MEILSDPNPEFIAYKGFRSDMTCRGVQYAVGETTFDSNLPADEYPEAGERGLHAALNPFDVFAMYPPVDGTIYAEVTVTGDVDQDLCGIIAGRALRVNRILSIMELLEICSKYKDNTGNSTLSVVVKQPTGCAPCDAVAIPADDRFAVAINMTRYGSTTIAASAWSAVAYTVDCDMHAIAKATSGFSITNGNRSDAYALDGVLMAATAGNDTIATNNFDSLDSHAQVSTEGSAAVALRNGKARGPVGSWLVLGTQNISGIKSVKAFYVDGSKIKANMWYSLGADGETPKEHGCEPSYV